MNQITIRQSPEQTRRALELNRQAEIDSIRLQKARVDSPSLLKPIADPITVAFSMKAKAAPAPKDLLRLLIDFSFDGLAQLDPKPEKPRRVLRLQCTYEVDYRLLDGFRPDEAIIRAFKDGNAIFNCWPYFREFLQSTLTRMGFPPLAAPFLRLAPRPRKDKPKPAQTKSP